MILTGSEIKRELGSKIFIEPFQEEFLNPNSYNLRLHDELLVYTQFPLDMKKKNPTKRLRIPTDGLELQPGNLYLGRTHEQTRTEGLVPMLEGRSSIGRLGMFVHVSAGVGDVGFDGFWTLEVLVIHPLVIYPLVEVCQIFYHTTLGELKSYQSSKYQHNEGIQPSLLFRDFKHFNEN
ncbi:dCTP deaminase [bacterium]|nr:dCTP deaminase [bacterium]